ncbi:MAG TPA: MerR family transcriptional regulator [Streptosporangiaceae bacterium]|nr:MerR family transcriptional regulator [Streptosporangiaceae bacterium]
MNASFARAYLGIGEVLVELRAEFPDISVSKIRFLESEGLISPARSPSGYRRFGPADVEQLRYVLTAQRDEYLPLRIIKERLKLAEGAGGRPTAGDAAQRNATAGPGGGVRTEMLSRRELLDAAGIDEKMLAELEAHGLVKRAGRLYGQDAVDIAATVAALTRYGVQARNLRTVGTAADRDLSLIEQLVGPVLRQRDPAARQSAGQTATQIASLLLRLHRHLLDAGLAEAGLAGAGPTEPARAEPSRRQAIKGASA